MEDTKDDQPPLALTDLLGGVRPLRLPVNCVTHHSSCECREQMVLQGLVWIAREIMTHFRKADDAPMSAEQHLMQALKMTIDLRNRLKADQIAVELDEDAREFIW